MNTTMAVNALISMAALAILLYLWVRAYPAMRVEEFRQNVFRLRNDMFDSAARGDISFQDSMYGILRTMMNGMLRDAENITLVQFIGQMVLIARYRPPNRFNELYEPARNALPLARRKIYDEYFARVSISLFQFISRRSVFVYMLFQIFGWFGHIRGKFANLLVPAARQTEYNAYQIGKALHLS